MTTQELVQKYKAFHKKKTGKEISDDEALKHAMKLVTLVKAVYQPIPKKWLDEFNKQIKF